MSIPAFIAERGFRKWYERELIRGHAHLVLLLLATLGVIGGLEAFSERGAANRLLMVASLLVAAVIGVWALRRYLYHLMRAEAIANQAVCAQCDAYARWLIERSEPATEQGDGAMAVRCRKCGHRWRIEL
jgi:DNA-directed RNA polymerase subunit RPC12/RpoP